MPENTLPPATSTLFSFATLRAPELVNGPIKGYLFIDTNLYDSPFRDLLMFPLERKDQLIQLREIAATYEPRITTVDQVKDVVEVPFYNFANWLAKNRKAVANLNPEENNYAQEVGLSELGSNPKRKLWDNLFISLVENKTPDVAEQIIQVLVASHFLRQRDHHHQDNINPSIAALARVVIPQYFFGTENGVPIDTTNDLPIVQERRLVETAATAIAKETVDESVLAAEEFLQLRKEYNSEMTDAYNLQKADHEATIANLIANAETQTDPETGETHFVNLILPAFVFNRPTEINEEILQGKLSASSIFIANKLGLFSLDTFSKVEEKLATHIKAETSKVFRKANLSRSVVSGVTTIFSSDDTPINLQVQSPNTTPNQTGPNNTGTGTTPNNPYPYVAYLDTFSGGYRIVLTVDLGLPSLSVVQAQYNAKYENASHIDTAFNLLPAGTNGNAKVLAIFPSGFQLANSTTFINMFLNLTLSSGLIISAKFTLQITGNSTGNMSDWQLGTGGDPGNGGDDGNDNPDPTVDTTFIPEGYGFRRLGIADYRKVEQWVCCYMPGEVSHIENVMAKEYKERSTRKLRRSEDTTTTEKQAETEKQTDTATTSRFDMHQEVSSIMSQQNSASANAGISASHWGITAFANGSFASNTTKEQSNAQAVNYAQEVTQKALERIVTKVREERVTKIIEEFEEQNKHGFDNRGDNAVHISGVYRWVDKIYKNQIHNYGKRLMYEFCLPNPASFHVDVLTQVAGSSLSIPLTRPVDPRTAQSAIQVANYNQLTAGNFAYWAAAFNVDVEPPPPSVITVSIGNKISMKQSPYEGEARNWHDRWNSAAGELEIPDGYECSHVRVLANLMFHPTGLEWAKMFVQVGDNVTEFMYLYYSGSTPIYTPRGSLIPSDMVYNAARNQYYAPFYFATPISKKLPITCMAYDIEEGVYTVSAECNLTSAALDQWKMKAFGKIMDAYERKVSEYNEAVSNTGKTFETNPGFYRQIENTVLRKSCLSYLVDPRLFGRPPIAAKDYDKYASLVRFMEQAFEWNIISYNFYPFYWSSQQNWSEYYQRSVDDPLFRAFLQAGMARVVVTVTPGFEEAVMHYMATGQVWNGGQVPTMGDDLYLSVIDELQQPPSIVEETWETRVPSSLTVIQSDYIALNASGLPCGCDEEGDSNKNKLDVLVDGLKPHFS